MFFLFILGFQITKLDTLNIQNKDYLKLEYTGAGELRIPGNPLLPVITKLIVAVHPRESVTVKTYVSGHNESKSSVLAEFDHKYEYGKVPPVTVTSILPSQ